MPPHSEARVWWHPSGDMGHLADIAVHAPADLWAPPDLQVAPAIYKGEVECRRLRPKAPDLTLNSA